MLREAAALALLALLALVLSAAGQGEVRHWSVTVAITVLVREGGSYRPLAGEFIELNLDGRLFRLMTNSSGAAVIRTAKRATADYMLRRFALRSVALKSVMFLEGVDGDITYSHLRWVMDRVGPSGVRYRALARVVPRVVKLDAERGVCRYELRVRLAEGRVARLVCLNPASGRSDVRLYEYSWIPSTSGGLVCLPADAKSVEFVARLAVRADSAMGPVVRWYRLRLSAPLPTTEGRAAVLDLTPVIASAVHSMIRREAEELRGRLLQFELWDADMESRYSALLRLLESSEAHFRAGDAEVGSYETTAALRLLGYLVESGKYVNVLGNYFVAPVLLLAMVLSSHLLARVVSERRWRATYAAILASCCGAFLAANSYLRLYATSLASPLFAEPLGMRVFRLGLLSLVGGVAVALALPRVVSRLGVLELTVRSICSRRRRFALALAIVALVSSASASHVSVRFSRAMLETSAPVSGASEGAVVVEKLSVNYLYGEAVSARRAHFSEREALWLLSMSRDSSCVGYGRVAVEANGREVEVPAAVANVSFLAAHCALTSSLTEYDSSTLGRGVLLSEGLASRLGVGVGSTVEVAGSRATVAGVFRCALELRDADGRRLLDSEVDVIVPLSRERLGLFRVVRVSLVLRPEEAEALAEFLAAAGLDVHKFSDPSAHGGRGGIRVVGTTYNVTIVAGGVSRSSALIHGEFSVAGAWEMQLALIAMGALMVFVTALGSVYERRREAQVLSSLGATPSALLSMFALEGLAVGLAGGVVGFILAFAYTLGARAVLGSAPVSTLGLTELFIVLAIGSLTAALGYALPTLKAVLLVVPSGRYLLSAAGELGASRVVRRERRLVAVQLPFKFQPGELRLLEEFLSSVFGRLQSDRMYGLSLERQRREASGRCVRYTYEGSLKSPWHGLPIPIRLAVELEVGDVVAVTVTVESKWDLSLVRSEVRSLISSVRESFLYYIEWKRSREGLAAQRP